MRKKFIAGNWKMNKTIKESIALVRDLKVLVRSTDKDVLVCPPFVALADVREILKNSNIKLGAQNMHHEDSGAYTGEISPLMLKDLCEYVIVGHSERRAYFDEDNSTVNRKIKKALEHGLKPIVCVGEKLEEREAGKTKEIVGNHVKGAFEGLSNKDALNVTVAYEPVWAIGTGKTATAEQAEEVHRFIRDLIKESYDRQTAEKIRILYGGSVKPENASELLSKKDIDGALVGGASLDAEKFSKIAK